MRTATDRAAHAASPPTLATPMKWDGEWHITFEVFRDLGIAFAAVLVLIYVLVVGWFQSFLTPLVIMAAIPFSLVGILPAHGLLGAFFTATSMIGFIAGAGIVVRNSIILVDFIELRLSEGMPLDRSRDRCGRGALPADAADRRGRGGGLGVILFDPIFQGLAIALMAGEDRLAAAVAHDRAGAVLSCSTEGGGTTYECGTDVAFDCGRFRGGQRGARLLGAPRLLPVHGFCRAQPVSVRLHQLVPDDDDSAQVGRPGLTLLFGRVVQETLEQPLGRDLVHHAHVAGRPRS